MNTTKIKQTLAAAENTAQQAVDKAARVATDAKAQVSDAMEQAEDGYDDLRDAASSTMAQAKATLADSGDRLATALRDAADGSRHASSRVMEAVAGGVSDATDRFRGGSLTDLVSSTQAYARRHPAAFAAGAAIAGFALARFMQASARKGPRG